MPATSAVSDAERRSRISYPTDESGWYKPTKVGWHGKPFDADRNAVAKSNCRLSNVSRKEQAEDYGEPYHDDRKPRAKSNCKPSDYNRKPPARRYGESSVGSTKQSTRSHGEPYNYDECAQGEIADCQTIEDRDKLDLAVTKQILEEMFHSSSHHSNYSQIRQNVITGVRKCDATGTLVVESHITKQVQRSFL